MLHDSVLASRQIPRGRGETPQMRDRFDQMERGIPQSWFAGIGVLSFGKPVVCCAHPASAVFQPPQALVIAVCLLAASQCFVALRSFEIGGREVGVEAEFLVTDGKGGLRSLGIP